MYIFGVTTGKLLQTIDESDAAYESLFAQNGLLIDAFHFAKRLKLEATLREKVPTSGIPKTQATSEGLQSPINCVFDRSERFAVYGSPFGVKTVNVRFWRACEADRHGRNRGDPGRSGENGAVSARVAVPGRFARVVAAADRSSPREKRGGNAASRVERRSRGEAIRGERGGGERPMHLRDVLRKKAVFRVFAARAGHERRTAGRDQREGSGGGGFAGGGGRGAEEFPGEAGNSAHDDGRYRAGTVERRGAEGVGEGDGVNGSVENFSNLCRSGYYDNVVFHRVIKNFMIQTGDPTGTGRGGESMWGTPFEDEYAKGVEFDKPFLLAMANSGPNSNGSQFFITTAPAAWLNRKHTIFGKVLKGQSVVKDIERARVKNDTTYRPFDDMKIVSTETYTK